MIEANQHKPVRVAILDSGVNVDHPHIGSVGGGCAITEDGWSGDYIDHLGHGTAVAAAIHEKAPDAELIIVKIFHRSQKTTISQLVRGMEWAIDQRVDVINLSLGTTNATHRPQIQSCVDKAKAAAVLVVSAFEMDGQPCFPGSLEGVVGVVADASMPRDQIRMQDGRAAASPFPRPIPGLPVERNLAGISFAVANVSGYICAQLAAQRA